MGPLVVLLKTLGVVAAFVALVLWVVGAVHLARFARHRWARSASTSVEVAAALKRRSVKCMLAFAVAMAVSAACGWLADLAAGLG